MIKLKNHSHIKKYNRKASNKYWRLPDLFNNKFDKNNNKETEEIKINATLDLHRRQVLKLMGASIAVTGIGVACRRPESKILSYSKQPEDVIPGISNYFATAMPRADGALGLVVESHEGKPTKIEGNAKHSSSYGASDFWSQASILELYDPDRSRNPINRINGNRKLSVWSEFEQFSNSHFSKFIKSKGVGLSFLTGVDDSPTALRLKKVIARKFTKSSWYVHDQLYNNNTKIGTYSFFGKNTRVCYNFDKAKIIFALQADSLMVGPNHLKNAYGFGLGRKIYKGKDFNKMNRLYVAEAGYTVTGSNADHRLPISASDSLLFLKSLALELFMNLGLKWPDGVIGSKNDLIESINHGVIFNNIFIKELAKDLIKNKDRSLIVIGENQDPIVHSLGHLLNLSLGGLGKTFSIFTIDKYSWDTESFKNIVQLTNDVNNGLVNTLVIIDSNPAYNSSYKLNFVNCLKSIKYTIHCGLYDDETAKLCDWHLPMSHFLESWGDTRAYSGEASIIQPLIYPIHNSKSKFEFLFLLANNFHKDGYYLVRETWKKIFNKKLFSIKTWEKALHDGIIEDTVFKVKRVSYFDILRLIDSLKDNNCLQINEQNLELIFENDYSLADGRFSNISWLQEMPDPISKLSWSNALYISPALAKFLGLKSRIIKRVYSSQIVRLEIGNKYLELPTFILPGLNGYSLSVSLGYGRKSSGYIGNKIGVNAYNFLPKDGKKVISGVNISLTKQFVELASTQEQFSMNAGVIQEINTFSMNGRDPVRHADLMQYKNNPNYVRNRQDI